MANQSESSRIDYPCREFCLVDRGFAYGMENWLACLHVRPADPLDNNHWGYLDSCGGHIGWARGSSAINPLHPSDFNRYGSVLVCNDSALMFSQLSLTDGMRRPVSGRDAVYAPKLSTCSEAQEIKETGNEEA